jgi:hypothetical protein
MKSTFLKRIVPLLSVLCIFCMSISAAADTPSDPPQDSGMQINNIYISSTSENVTISGGVATCTASARATSVIDEITIVSKLQRYQNNAWVTLQTFTETAYTYYASLVGTCNVDRGYSYRLVTTYQAYIGGVLEETVNKTYNYGTYT